MEIGAPEGLGVLFISSSSGQSTFQRKLLPERKASPSHNRRIFSNSPAHWRPSRRSPVRTEVPPLQLCPNRGSSLGVDLQGLPGAQSCEAGTDRQSCCPLFMWCYRNWSCGQVRTQPPAPCRHPALAYVCIFPGPLWFFGGKK